MLIGIDLDSVLADLMIPLNDFHNDRYGTRLVTEDYVDYNLARFWNCSRVEAMERVYDFYDSPLMDTIPLIPGSIEGINYLRQHHQLIVITSRPDSTETSTTKWINRYFPNTFSRVILSNQFSKYQVKAKTKGMIGKELGIEAMIDDHIEYIQDCDSYGIQSYLFKAPWNQDKEIPPHIIFLRGWHEVPDYF
jgi:uncharacterized HAD superfamily protein